MNLDNFLNQSPFIFYFLVVDEFLDIDLFPRLKNFHLIYAYNTDRIKLLKDRNAPYFCLEENGFSLEEKNTGRLLSHPQVIEYIQNTSQKADLKPVIIPFKPSAKIDLLCQKHDWINASNGSSLNRLLEDKIKFPQICQKKDIPIIPLEIDTFTQNNFIKYQNIFNNSHLVIQTHFGWAGNSTFNANTWDEVKDRIAPGTVVKYSPFFEGYSLLNNCCLTKKGLIQSPPALQYTGLKPFTDNPFTTVGRQWPSFAPTTIQEQIKVITQNFSLILQELGYKGFFGLDFLVNGDKVYLLECNPRLTASFAFYTDIELKQNLTPLFFFHLLEFINIDYDFNLEEEQSRFYNQKIIGSEITQKDRNQVTIKKINDFSSFSLTCNPITIQPQIVKKFDLQK
jgi:hypothetical protein